MLELRVAIETECAGLAAQRISAAEIEALRLALEAIEQDQAEGNDSATSDLQFHLSIARATGNEHFVGALA
ncbi:FadR/GntR family transcriptional regulator, partial [Escherichia coli]